MRHTDERRTFQLSRGSKAVRVPALVLNQIAILEQKTGLPSWLAVEKALDNYILSLPTLERGESDIYLIDWQRQIREKRLMMHWRLITGTQRARGWYYKMKARQVKPSLLEYYRKLENEHIDWLEAKEKELIA